jgi:hypothetical protein
MMTRSTLNRVFMSFIFILSAALVAGCNKWAFRLRERPDVSGDKPHSLALRCTEQPVRFAVRKDGLVRSFGPVVLTCDSSNPATACSGEGGLYTVKAGAWLMVNADGSKGFSKDASTANGALCWVKDTNSAECADESNLLDLYIECPQ